MSKDKKLVEKLEVRGVPINDKGVVDWSGKIKAELDQLPPLDITGTPLPDPHPAIAKTAEVTACNSDNVEKVMAAFRTHLQHRAIDIVYQGEGGCPTCGHGASEVVDWDVLLQEIDAFSATFK